MSAPYHNLPAPRFAPPKPSPLSQGTSFLSSDPPTAGPSGGGGSGSGAAGEGGGASSKKKKHYYHHGHARKESQSGQGQKAGSGGETAQLQPPGSNKRKREHGSGIGTSGGGQPVNNGKARPHRMLRCPKRALKARPSASLASTTTTSGDATPARQFATQIVKLVDALKVHQITRSSGAFMS